jgi:hypothetical protein
MSPPQHDVFLLDNFPSLLGDRFGHGRCFHDATPPRRTSHLATNKIFQLAAKIPCVALLVIAHWANEPDQVPELANGAIAIVTIEPRRWLRERRSGFNRIEPLCEALEIGRPLAIITAAAAATVTSLPPRVTKARIHDNICCSGNIVWTCACPIGCANAAELMTNAKMCKHMHKHCFQCQYIC